MITKTDYAIAIWQWTTLGLLSFAGIFIGLLIVYPIAITWLKIKYDIFVDRPEPNMFGELFVQHKDKYKDHGSSGWWEFWNIGGLFWPWGNDEDGFLGEPSGKHSAREDGEEKSWGAMYRWCMRNPFNNAKRYWAPMRCMIEECDIHWQGKGDIYNQDGELILNDNEPLAQGRYFVMAVHRTTGRKYFSFRRVQQRSDGKVIHILFGFKVKPKHIGESFDDDDKEKGFTFRASAWANAN